MKNLKIILGSLIFISLLPSCYYFFKSPCSFSSLVYIEISEDSSIMFYAGETSDFEIKLIPDPTMDAGIGRFVISEGEKVLVDTNYNNLEEPVIFNFSYTVSENAECGEEILLSVEVTEFEEGETTIESIEMNVYCGQPIITDMGSLIYTSATIEEDFIIACNNYGAEVVNGNSTDGDIAFVWNYNLGYTLVSPNAEWIANIYSYNGITYNISDKRETKIALYTGEIDWSEFTDEIISELEVNSSTIADSGNGVQNLQDGDIIIFETEDGRRGILKVMLDSKVTQTMGFEIKYQSTVGSA